MLAVSPDVQSVCHPRTATITVGPRAGRGASRAATLALRGLNHSPGACKNEDSQKFWLPRMCRAQKLAFAIRVFGNSNSRGSENHFFFFFLRNQKVDYLYPILLSILLLKTKIKSDLTLETTIYTK